MFKVKKYYKWTKHANDFKSDISTISFLSDKVVSICVHPQHESINIFLESESFIPQIKDVEKSLQLYFYGFVWLGYCDIKGNIDFIENLLLEIFQYCKLNPIYSKNEMIWDDHAVAERISVLLYLKESGILGDVSEDCILLLEEHLLQCKRMLDFFVSSSKWCNNNHRLFHLCGVLSYYVHKGEEEKVSQYAAMVRDFISYLIDYDTGLSIEQSVSYYSFDIILVRIVFDFLKEVGIFFNDLRYDDILIRSKDSLASLSFPCGSLPASGDTPLGLCVKNRIALSVDKHREIRSYLSKIGHYRIGYDDDSFNAHLITHNSESAHGHFSPLHIDIWAKDFGNVLVDSGGPYLYGNKLRYSWFRNIAAHNCVHVSSFLDNIIDIKCGAQITKKSVDDFLISDSIHQERKILIEQNEITVEDVISSSEDWTLSFHLDIGIDLLSHDLKSGKHLVLRRNDFCIVMLITTDFNISIADTYRTLGRGKKEFSKSILVSGSPTKKTEVLVKLFSLQKV